MQSTPAGKAVIYEVSTGRRIERWPVDALPMVKSGEFTATPPEGVAPEPAVTPEQRGLVETGKPVVVPGLKAEQESRKQEQGRAPVSLERIDAALQEDGEKPAPPPASPVLPQQLPAEAAPGVPLKATRSDEATPAQKIKLPEAGKRTTKRKK